MTLHKDDETYLIEEPCVCLIVPRNVCMVRFQKAAKREEGDIVAHRLAYEGRTVDGDMLLLFEDGDGKVFEIELISGAKPCQALKKPKSRSPHQKDLTSGDSSNMLKKE